jgi:hypothetical protein
MDTVQMYGISALFLLIQLLRVGWYIAVLVLLYKIWQKMDRLPS